MSKDVSIEEGNKLIIRFMKYKDDQAGWGQYTIPNYGSMSITELKFHSSWDWLMPVVEKANKLNGEIQKKVSRHEWDDGEDKDLDDPTGWRAWSYRYISLSTDINYVWKKTVQFIQWYNNQNKTP